jgi:hypothetical protein
MSAEDELTRHRVAMAGMLRKLQRTERRAAQLLRIARVLYKWCKRTGLRFDLALKELDAQCPTWKDAIGREWLEPNGKPRGEK